MISYAIYNMSNGVIRGMVTGATEHLLIQLSIEESLIPALIGITDVTHWVDHATGTFQCKVDYQLSALPLPCTVTIEGVVYEVTSQPTFEFDAPGVYTIQVDAGPKYLKKEFTIDSHP